MTWRSNTVEGLLVLALVFAANAGKAAAEDTPTEKVARCVNNSWAHYTQCLTEGGWLHDQLCVVKFEADAIGCSLEYLPL